MRDNWLSDFSVLILINPPKACSFLKSLIGLLVNWYLVGSAINWSLANSRG